MQIKATPNGMKPFTTDELRQHIIAVDVKFQKMPSGLRRYSMDRWTSNRGAIIRELARRESAAT